VTGREEAATALDRVTATNLMAQDVGELLRTERLDALVGEAISDLDQGDGNGSSGEQDRQHGTTAIDVTGKDIHGDVCA
jgi:hypothetical protein